MLLHCKNKKCLENFRYHGKKNKEFDRITCPKCNYKYPLWKLKLTNKEIGNSKLTQPQTNAQMSEGIANPKYPGNEGLEIHKGNKKQGLDRNTGLYLGTKTNSCRGSSEEVFTNLQDFNNAVFESGNSKKFNLSKPLDQEEVTKLCKKHNQPAIYSTSSKKWKCIMCYSEEESVSKGKSEGNIQDSSEISTQKVANKEQDLTSFSYRCPEPIPIIDEFGNFKQEQELFG